MELEIFTFRMICAVLAGSIIGLERQLTHKDAGLRTNTLVSVGSCLFVLISVSLQSEGVDISRIIGQVVTGIGFIGGGVILHEGLNIKGLTTAATIWCSSALGCLAGIGLHYHLLIATIFVVSINIIYRYIDIWIDRTSLKNNNK